MDLVSLTFRSLSLGEITAEDFPVENKEQTNHLKERVRLKKPKDETRSDKDDSTKKLKSISLDEVAWHDTADDCWLVIYDFVYDCTDFLSSHPGGCDVLLEYAGRDATLAFIGTGHSTAARESLEMYLIGELPPEERIFRIPGGVRVAGF